MAFKIRNTLFVLRSTVSASLYTCYNSIINWSPYLQELVAGELANLLWLLIALIYEFHKQLSEYPSFLGWQAVSTGKQLQTAVYRSAI